MMIGVCLGKKKHDSASKSEITANTKSETTANTKSETTTHYMFIVTRIKILKSTFSSTLI